MMEPDDVRRFFTSLILIAVFFVSALVNSFPAGGVPLCLARAHARNIIGGQLQ
jgi:hypothetical protein